MNELRTITIKIEAYRDPEGHPVCATAVGQCSFFGTDMTRSTFICTHLQTRLRHHQHDADPRDLAQNSDDHYLRPDADCPVWT